MMPQPITGLSGHVLLMQAETAEASDWLQRQVMSLVGGTGSAGTENALQASYVFFLSIF